MDEEDLGEFLYLAEFKTRQSVETLNHVRLKKCHQDSENPLVSETVYQRTTELGPETQSLDLPNPQPTTDHSKPGFDLGFHFQLASRAS